MKLTRKIDTEAKYKEKIRDKVVRNRREMIQDKKMTLFKHGNKIPMGESGLPIEERGEGSENLDEESGF